MIAMNFLATPRLIAWVIRLCMVSLLTMGGSFWGPVSAADAPIEVIAQAADGFLAMLTDGQRRTVQFDFDDSEQRARWSNLPVNMVKRAGLRMGDLAPAQREAVWRLLRATLSEKGYEKVVGIVRGDEVLKRRGGNARFGEDEFFLSLLGQPSTTAPWMIQFGGHHLALNITLAGEQGVLTPSLIAVQPARFEWGGKTVEPLGRETAKALELVNSLTADQQREGILGYEMRDLALGPGHDGETIQPEGVKVSTFTPAQRELLLALISEWSNLVYDEAARKKMAEVRGYLGETWFAWAGPRELGKGYFRVQGPTIIIEYAPQRLGGDVTMHVHTQYRDPTDDYGARLTRR